MTVTIMPHAHVRVSADERDTFEEWITGEYVNGDSADYLTNRSLIEAAIEDIDDPDLADIKNKLYELLGLIKMHSLEEYIGVTIYT